MPYTQKAADFSVLLGKTLTEIEDGIVGADTLTFVTADGKRYQLTHEQDGSEVVEIVDVDGDYADLLHSPLTMAELIYGVTPIDWDRDSYAQESQTWNFYKLATVKGYVTIRWLSESNSYYSEDVYFCELVEEDSEELMSMAEEDIF